MKPHIYRGPGGTYWCEERSLAGFGKAGWGASPAEAYVRWKQMHPLNGGSGVAPRDGDAPAPARSDVS